MAIDLFTGEKVRLCAEEPQDMAAAFSRWGQNSEYLRMLDSAPPSLLSPKKFQEWLEKDAAQPGDSGFLFSIHTLADDRLIGFTGLFGFHWNQGEAWVAIGLGESQDWSHGYGTDAMRLALRFAFQELNLHRVSLGVYAYNQRAVRSYEKAGFTLEGSLRGELQRDGRRWDNYFMGVLRHEWEARQEKE